jgi:hypothetical protein
VVTSSLFTSNLISLAGLVSGAVMGGGLYGSSVDSLLIQRTTFRGNNITSISAGSHVECEGGGMALQSSNATIQWSNFIQVRTGSRSAAALCS